MSGTGLAFGRKQQQIVRRKFSSLNVDAKAIAIGKILKNVKATVDCIIAKNSGYKKGGSTVLFEILKYFSMSGTEKNLYNMYTFIRRNHDKIEKCMADMNKSVYKENEEKSNSKAQTTSRLAQKEPMLTDSIDSYEKSNPIREPETMNVWNVSKKRDNTSMKSKSVISTSDLNAESTSKQELTRGIIHSTKVAIEDHDTNDDGHKIITVTLPLVEDDYEPRACKDQPRRRFGLCNVMIGRFDIEKNIWCGMLEASGKLKTSVYPQTLSQKFFSISKGCVLQVQYCRMLRGKTNKIATIYAYCGHNLTTTFKFVCWKNQHLGDIEVRVYSNSRLCTHLCKKTRELSGCEREAIKKQIINEHPRLTRLKMVDGVDKEGVALYNIQQVKSGSVFRKVKAEALAVDDLHPDPLTDLFQMRSSQTDRNTRYVQYVTHPLQVVMFNKESLELANIAKNNTSTNRRDFTVHIDATGSVVRPTKECKDETSGKNKRVLYYATVFSVGDTIVPLTEFISSNHSTPFICNWLMVFKKFLQENKSWPLFCRIVCDFSWALIHSILLSFNTMNITDYLQICHKFIINKEGDLPTVTIHLCVCHFVKMCVDDIASVTVDKNNDVRSSFKYFVMQVLATIMQCSAYEDIQLMLQDLLVVLLSKTENPLVVKAMYSLTKLCKPINLDDFEVADEENEEASNKKYKTLYEQSPFYRDSVAIVEKVKRAVNEKRNNLNRNELEIDDMKTSDKVIKNKYNNEKMAEIVVKKYFPYLPLWSGLLLRSKNNTILKRMSNAPVENWFKQLKSIVLGDKRNLRVNRFVRKTRQYVLAVHKEVTMDLPKEGCARGKRQKDAHKKKEIRIPKGKVSKIKKKHVQDLVLEKKITVEKVNEEKNNHGNNVTVIEISDAEDIDMVEEVWKDTKQKHKKYFFAKHIEKRIIRNKQIPKRAEKYITKLVMDNYLVNDPCYYVLCNTRDPYYVCRLPNRDNDFFTLGVDDYLLLKEYDQWLNSDVITQVSHLFLNHDPNNEIVIFRPEVTSAALMSNNKFDLRGFLKGTAIVQSTKKLFLPLNIGNTHWVLVYVHLERNEFAYIDPAHVHENAHVVRRIVRKFNEFIYCMAEWRQYVKTKNWVLKEYKHPLQDFSKDTINCGVFILYFIEQLIKQDHISVDFEPKDYRDYLSRELLRNSADMSPRCLSCRVEHSAFGPPTKDDECVECSACKRWYHVHKPNCLPDDVPKQISILQGDKMNIYCSLCRIYYENHIAGKIEM